jgi:hypothetical protein
MTRDQLARAVTDVTAALRPYCLADDVAEERARNIVQAVIDEPVHRYLAAILAALETRVDAFSAIGPAAIYAHRALRVAICETNADRFVLLYRSGMSAEEASAYLQRHGWTVPEGMVRA